MKLMTLGTIALDNIKIASGERRQLLGGSASHFCMSARLFTKIHLASIIGTDFPSKYRHLLKNKGIDLSSVLVGNDKNFQWDGEYKQGDFNTAITRSTELGVLKDYSPQIRSDQRHIPNIFLANFDPDVQMKFLNLMKNPKFIGMDTMNLWLDIKRKSVMKLIKRVNLLVLNDGEANMLSGESNIIKAAKYLRALGPEFIVIKKGEHGVLFYCDRFMFTYPAFPVENVIDPTGAGDTFAGGLMGYLGRSGKINENVLPQFWLLLMLKGLVYLKPWH